MRLKPQNHDYVVQPDGRIFHVEESRWWSGQPSYHVVYEERHHFKSKPPRVRRHLEWARGRGHLDRHATQALADRLEELVKQAGGYRGSQA